MLNSTNTRIVFIVALFGVALLDWKHDVSIWVYVLIVLAYMAIVFYGSYFIQSGFFVKALYKGPAGRKAIAITFDDGPMGEFTPQVLDILKTEKAPAAFFLIGKNVGGNTDLAKRIYAEGHLVGNHSYSHTYWFSLNNKQTILNDLKQCDEALYAALGKRPKLFRPPYGVTNPMVAAAIKNGNYQCIGWSIRTYDTNAKSAEQLLKKSLKNLSNGDIILFHDWGKYTIGILSEYIQQVRSRGFEIVRADELLNIEAYY